jgi:putative zinc finger/helix-turn-helix YgiT family protein
VPTKPFPWKCAACRERAVYPATVDYATTLEHDGRAYDVGVPGLEVPRCRNCGTLVMVDSANRAVSDALRAAAGLLTPAQIRKNREDLGLTQKQLASHLGVADATVSRWETGAQIQQRSLDRLLRLYFGIPSVRTALADEARTAQLGTTVVRPTAAVVVANIRYGIGTTFALVGSGQAMTPVAAGPPEEREPTSYATAPLPPKIAERMQHQFVPTR